VSIGKNLLVLIGLGAVLTLSAAVWGVPDDDKSDPQADATYVGEKACKKCHMKQFRTYKKMKHYKAWDNLPEEMRDPSKKDDEGRACISCHTTGYGDTARKGFVDAATSEGLTGVQCEACHGPGSKHKAAGEQLAKEERKEFNEGEETFITLKTTNCSDCHNPHINYAKKYGQGG
jgi:hypothetical protein